MVLTRETIRKENSPGWSGNIAVDFIEVGRLSKDGLGIVSDKYLWTNRFSLAGFIEWMEHMKKTSDAKVVVNYGWQLVLADASRRYICRIEGMDQQKEPEIEELQNIMRSAH